MNADKQAMEEIVFYPSSTAVRAPSIASETKIRKEIMEAINPVIADGFALYEKTKNFYLNADVVPRRDYRLLFDEQAREIFDSMDALAGQLRQMGAAPLRSISHSGELQSVENYNGEILSPGEMIKELIADNQRLADSVQDAGKFCEKVSDKRVSILLRDILDKTEGRIKFLSEVEM